ncbi:hypothetical protein ASG90_02815 [Nocardioides sp. Soil797]|nr:hypothetical protein ASG90_02815 [Nocardioides sp. Soil797]
MNQRNLPKPFGLAALAALVVGMLVPVLVASPAHAAASVSVSNSSGTAQIDTKYATNLTVSGSGFQAIKGGHGGAYVWFGTVDGNWRPSQGGVSGKNYLYVPDSESANNEGFQRFVAFPGSDTASSAAATMSENGSWRTTITVPGPTFKAVGRNGAVTTVDCRKVQCGVITVGAHGVKNAHNETFTPVSVGTASTPQEQATTDPQSTTQDAAPDATPRDAGAEPVKLGKPKLEVDRSSAVAGRVLSFSVAGIAPKQQLSVVFDDGRAAAGPFLVGDDGRLAGVITLPADLPAGTYELRVFGVDKPPSVKFAVRAADEVSAAESQATSSATSSETDTWGMVFVGVAGALLLVALLRLVLMARGRRHAA